MGDVTVVGRGEAAPRQRHQQQYPRYRQGVSANREVHRDRDRLPGRHQLQQGQRHQEHSPHPRIHHEIPESEATLFGFETVHAAARSERSVDRRDQQLLSHAAVHQLSPGTLYVVDIGGVAVGIWWGNIDWGM